MSERSNAGRQVSGTPLFRRGFAVAAAIAILALMLHTLAWYHGGRADLPYAANIGGLAVLMLLGALDPPSGLASRLGIAGGVALVLCGAIATLQGF